MNAQNAVADILWCSAGEREGDRSSNSIREGGEAEQDLLGRAPTLVKQEALEWWLMKYGDKKAAALLQDGFHWGFRLGYEVPRVRRWAENLQSAKTHAAVVRKNWKGGMGG